MTEQLHRLSEEARSIANEAKERLLKLNDKPELSRPYLVKGFLSKISRGISSKEAVSKFSTAIVTSLLGYLWNHILQNKERILSADARDLEARSVLLDTKEILALCKYFATNRCTWLSSSSTQEEENLICQDIAKEMFSISLHALVEQQWIREYDLSVNNGSSYKLFF